MGVWVQDLGEQIGSQLGAIIAESVQRSLQSTINVGDIARQLGAGGRGRGRRAGQRAVCSVAGCGRAVLAKGLCRSHYYRARYKAQKAGTLQPRKRGRRSASRKNKKTGSDSSGSEASSS
jgi:hypothetical protein